MDSQIWLVEVLFAQEENPIYPALLVVLRVLALHPGHLVLLLLKVPSFPVSDTQNDMILVENNRGELY